MTHPPEYEPPIPEPTLHPYEEDEFTGGMTCRVCGFDRGFGLLHGELLLEVPDDPPVRGCSRCQHFSHVGPCPDALPGYPRPVPCKCQGVRDVA